MHLVFSCHVDVLQKQALALPVRKLCSCCIQAYVSWHPTFVWWYYSGNIYSYGRRSGVQQAAAHAQQPGFWVDQGAPPTTTTAAATAAASRRRSARPAVCQPRCAPAAAAVPRALQYTGQRGSGPGGSHGRPPSRTRIGSSAAAAGSRAKPGCCVGGDGSSDDSPHAWQHGLWQRSELREQLPHGCQSGPQQWLPNCLGHAAAWVPLHRSRWESNRALRITVHVIPSTLQISHPRPTLRVMPCVNNTNAVQLLLVVLFTLAAMMDK